MLEAAHELTADLVDGGEVRLGLPRPDGAHGNLVDALPLSGWQHEEALAEELGAKVILQHEPDDVEPLGGVIR